MKKQIVSSIVALTLATGSLYAYGNGGFKDCDKDTKQVQKQQHMMQHKKSGFVAIMHALSQLDLPKQQWREIKIAILDMKKQNLQNSAFKGVGEYFNKKGFDKTAYLKEKSNFMQKKLESEAQAIEKITATLDAAQLQKLQEVIDMPTMYRNKKEKKQCRK